MIIKEKYQVKDRPLVSDILQTKIDPTHITNKSIIGLGSILMNDEPIDTFQNLVTLQGREFLASRITGIATGSKNWVNYKIGYFRIGDGGSDVNNPNTRYGPYDNDTDLFNKVKFSETEINTNTNMWKYMGGGYDKKIDNITIDLETHHIHTATEDIYVQNYTAIKCTLVIDDIEPTIDPFGFNEAALVAYEFDTNDNPVENTGAVIARFTTSTKQINDDKLTIEWFVLV
jgi:hypothetical protein